MEKIAQREELGGDKTKLELSKRAQQLLDRRGRFLPLPWVAAAKGKTSAGGKKGAELFFREIFTGTVEKSVKRVCVKPPSLVYYNGNTEFAKS